MKLIVGLGNPGAKYKLTRHNIGFIVLDEFAHKFDITFKEGIGDWWEGEGKIADKDVYVMKPATYMNNSGTAVKDFTEKNNIDIRDILIVVDDFQIPLGTIRFRKKGSDGGHNGLSSIINNLDTEDFPRMRIGIGNNIDIRKEDYIDFVLGNFNRKETGIIKKLIPDFNYAIQSFITDGILHAMNSYNRSFI
ncbi:MAG: aminoacyl-tRNA hydrolase [bacterium]